MNSEARGIWHDGAFTYVVGDGFNSTTGRNEALMWVELAPGCQPLGCRADWDGNCRIEPADVSRFINDWFTSLTTGTLAGDFDHNGVVAPADVGSFVSAWFASLSGPCPP